MGLGLQAAALDALAEEALTLAGEVRRCREASAGRAWSQGRDDAFVSPAAFHRRLRAIDLRRTELAPGL